MSKQLSGHRMREIAEVLKKEMPGVGFALLTFEFGDNPGGYTNYISNAQREDMKKALQEVLDRWNQEFKTPELN